MTSGLRFFVLCLPNVPWVDLRERVIRLETLGIEVAALPDHFVDWTNPSSPWFESWTALTGLAAATSSIRLTTSVTQVSLRNPAMFARQALTLDHISDGRLEIGLGTGLAGDPSYRMIGVPDLEPRERVARFAEYADIVDRLLRHEVTTVIGDHYRVEGASMNPRPIQSPRPPITIAAMGPVMMGHAVAIADIWNSLSFKESFEAQHDETSRRVEQMDGIREAAGRTRESLRYSYLMFDATARPRGGSIGSYESPDRFEEMATRVIDLGMDEIGLYYPLDPGQVPTFERIAIDVLPRLRTQAAARA